MPNFTVTYRYRGEDRTLEVTGAPDRTAAQADAEKRVAGTIIDVREKP